MYLQSLEMVGFKSFAPKTTLQFNPGVTAIVGPNGCGKSNVLDALRWVLGEQSAKALRGGEMADVIFSGTDSRSALGMAEVSLTFSDCEKELGVEWNEVRITRRVFRDGKSEYFLNKAPCRLKDIHQLFMDTGIGRSAYSIMEQGKIDAILSSRPEDRRAIFEEAAGITKYKAQKKEALRKLEYTEANLVRVTDIIKEVKRQIGSLQRQAAKARRYQSVMEDLRVFDTHLSHRNFTVLRDELKAVRGELDGTGETRLRTEREIEEREAELTSLRERLEELDLRTAEVRDNIQTQRNRITSAESRIGTNAERAAESRALIERYRGEIESGEEKLRDQESQIARTDEMIAEMLDLMRTGEEKLDGANARLSAAREERIAIERRSNSLMSEVSQLEGDLNRLRGEVATAGGRREAGEARLEMLKAEELTAQEVAREATATLDLARERRETADAARSAATLELEEAQAAHDEARSSRQAAETEVNQAARKVTEIESRLNVLKQLEASGEGFDAGTQAVLRGLDRPELFKPAVLGALAGFIDVESAHIPAIEAALGANLQAIVFKDTTLAEEAIRVLSEKKLGRAAVVPRDWMGSSSVASRAEVEGIVGWATDLVRTKDEAKGLIARLLDQVAVVETLDAAFRLRAEHPEFAFATLAGEFLSTDGIVHGGRGGDKGTSALVRKNEIASLESDLTEARRHVAEVTQRRDESIEELDRLEERLRAAREEMQAAQVEVSTAQSECGLAERQLKEAESRRANMEREVAQIEQSVVAALEKVTTLEGRIAGVQASLDDARSRQAEVAGQIEGARDRERVCSEELNELRLRVATERQQQESLTRQRGPMAARIAELTELLGQRARDIENCESRIRSFEAETQELSGNMGTWQALLESGEQQIEGLMTERSGMQGAIDDADQNLRQARRSLSELQEARGRFEVRASQLEMRSEHVAEHVASRYQVALSEFRPDTYALMRALKDRARKAKAEDAQPDPAQTPVEDGVEQAAEAVASVVETTPEAESEQGIPWDRIEELVVELTEKVDRMGPVNLDAIQEYEELEERHSFLEKQNIDLINSKAELLDVISKINRTTKELFAETFEKIRTNFQEMFTELFGGGKANLILVDESDPLESGIDIIAKPPGKQLQSISLLSGGEKTMTAVALLFSIYMVKPSPFCVLDEMDAPLDESNISRFIKILDRFVGQSQFVVITHNKRTIARADTVFGVTMEEHGVSKLVSVKFTGKDEGAEDQHPQSVAETFGKHGNLHSETGVEDVVAIVP